MGLPPSLPEGLKAHFCLAHWCASHLDNFGRAVCGARGRILPPGRIAEPVPAHRGAVLGACRGALSLEVVAHFVAAVAPTHRAVEWAVVGALAAEGVAPPVPALGKPAVSRAVAHRLSPLAVAHAVAAPAHAVLDASGAGLLAVAEAVAADCRAVGGAVGGCLLRLGAGAVAAAGGGGAVSDAALGGLSTGGVTEPGM
jgi:hypothetical protein